MAAVDVTAARKAFDLSLPALGPYSMRFTSSGRHALLGGERGHLALLEWQRAHLVCEVQVGARPVRRDGGGAGCHVATWRARCRRVCRTGPPFKAEVTYG